MLLLLMILFRYEKALAATRWNGIRQGTLFGILNGWCSLISYLVYTVGFICGSLLMSNNNPRSITISDIIVVSERFDYLVTNNRIFKISIVR